MAHAIKSIVGVPVKGKTVLFRPDINSPIDKNGKIVNYNRIEKTIPTLQYLANGGAKIAIISHQGDTLDYPNLISMREHAEILSKLSGVEIEYIDDVCGDTAIEKIANLECGKCVFLGNLRYLTEEVSTFEKDVKLNAEQMQSCYLVRRLAPLFDIYVNDAFSAAHRNSPSMVAFQKLMPSYAGPLFFNEYNALDNIMRGAKKPCIFLLGGGKISDAFGMMKEVLASGTADKILACGITGAIMLLANGIALGKNYEKFLADKDLLVFVEQGRKLLENYKEKFILPVDLAFEKNGERVETNIEDLPEDNGMFFDIGHKTTEIFCKEIANAKTIFTNGPAGVYENPLFKYGTEKTLQAISSSKAYSVVGGGDTVTATTKLSDTKKIDYVCTAGGAMVRFLSGKTLPLVEAMKNSK